MGDVETIVEHYRRTPVRGACIDLLPYRPEHAGAIVRLRNLPEVRYFLNQDFESTLESQRAWYEGYLTRRDDIFWVLQDKSGTVVGCNRLYEITPESAEKGSQIVEQQFGRAAPIALEADLLAIKLAFDAFGVRSVVAHVRHDNHKVHSMNHRMGFRTVASEIINQVPYDLLRLDRGAFQPIALDQLIDYWRNRGERRKT